MSKSIVFLDACVLYPAPLRDLLMHVALTHKVSVRWSEQIHDEWTRNVLKDRPELKPERIRRTREMMDRYVLDALVRDFEHLIPLLKLPDPDDRHVLAAAIYSECEAIVTFNLKDFPFSALKDFGICAVHPDVFLVDLFESDFSEIIDAVCRQRSNLKNPPKTADELLETFRQQGLTNFARLLEEHKHLF